MKESIIFDFSMTKMIIFKHVSARLNSVEICLLKIEFHDSMHKAASRALL